MAIETITWKDFSGTSHPFDGSGNYLALIGEQGNYLTPVINIDQRTPQRPGTTIRYVDIQPNVLTYPIVVTAASETLLRTAIRQLVEMFMLGPGTLIATAPDGSQRQCTAYYYDGLEGDGSERNRSPGSILFPLQVEVPSGFWQDTAATVNNYTNTQLGAGVTITNAGDYAAWPVWVFQGPMTNLVVTNTTTGQSFSLTNNGGLALASGHTLTVNTQAGTVIEDASTNVIGNLTPGSVLFSLAKGANALTFTYTAGVNGTTTGQVTYTNNWWSA